MPDRILEQARQKQQTRRAVAWIGGCCLVLVLAVGQLALLGWWANSRVTAQRVQLENMKRLQAQAEHPVLPLWVPVYPGSEAKGTAGKKEGEVALRTPDLPDRVLDFYAARLRANGFAVRPPTERAQVFELTGRRRDGSEVIVQSGMSPGGSWIVLSYKAGG